MYIPDKLFKDINNSEVVYAIVRELEADVGTEEDFKDHNAVIERIKNMGETEVYKFIKSQIS